MAKHYKLNGKGYHIFLSDDLDYYNHVCARCKDNG